MMIRRSLLSVVVVALFIAAATTVRSAGLSVRLIHFCGAVPPGGSIDVILRAMAPKLQERMGKAGGDREPRRRRR
jgi:tripartite-type tricarboxylate transporter receptor subunit TctC